MLRLFNNPIEFILLFAAFLVAITVHEFAHAWTSDRLGDPTARLMGRLTLNPLAHLDLVGTLMILFAPFGWAKPVHVDPFNLKNPRRDSALISLAGPLTNLLVAIGVSLLAFGLSPLFLVPSMISILLISFLKIVIILNVNLAVFNLVPIHPLDGFAIIRGLLSEDLAKQWQDLEPYGLLFLLFFAFPLFGGPSPLSRIISPIVDVIVSILLPSARII